MKHEAFSEDENSISINLIAKRSTGIDKPCMACYFGSVFTHCENMKCNGYERVDGRDIIWVKE